jgi:hypothetical protein
MTVPHDPDRVIAAFLTEGMYPVPERLYENISDGVRRTGQGLVFNPRKLVAASVRARLAMAAAAVVVVAIVGSNLGPTSRTASASPSATGTLSPSPAPTFTWDTGTVYSAISAGGYDVPWTLGRLRLTTPAGWMSATAAFGWCEKEPCVLPHGGTTLTKYPLEGPGPLVTLSLVHDVDLLLFGVCASPDADRSTIRATRVGPTADDLVTGLAPWVKDGDGSAIPPNMTLGGYPATRFQLTWPSSWSDACERYLGSHVWTNATTYGFDLPQDAAATVYVVDVNGRRLVLTSLERDASADDRAELAALIASIEIEPDETPSVAPATEFLPDGELLTEGRHSLTVAGIPLSIEVSKGAGNGWSSNGAFSISKSIKGPQGAEAGILWTTFPDGAYPFPCFDVLPRDAGRSASDLAAAMASAASDAQAVTGPTDVTVGGLPAKHVSFIVGDDRGCDPGFFFRWPALYGGPLWAPPQRGDTISAWVVDVDGVLLVVESMTTTEANPQLGEELQMIIDSIQFESRGS